MAEKACFPSKDERTIRGLLRENKQLMDKAKELQSDNEKLRACLIPFAAFGRHVNGDQDFVVLGQLGVGYHVQLRNRNFRDATELLEGTNG